MVSVNDVAYLFEDLKECIEEFYQKNADAAFGPILEASNRLDLYLKGDLQTLWRLEREEITRLREEVIRLRATREEELDVYSVDTDVGALKRDLTIMSRCVKKMTDNYRKECIEHEKTKQMVPGKIDDTNPIKSVIE